MQRTVFGQNATIARDGDDIGNGGKVYAEKVWSVLGSDGKSYLLVEIEQEGSDTDFFTFFGTVPPSDVSLTLKQAYNVTPRVKVDYAHLSAGAIGEPLPNIVEIAAGSDDFNILVKALSAAGLVETVQNLTDITVFAPTDAAFTSLALDLGYTGDEADEEAVFDFIVDALSGLGGGDPIPLLTDILLYHVSPGAKSAEAVDALDAVPTLLEGASFGSEGTELVDNEPDIANPNIVVPDIAAGNGTIQAIDRVLLPIDIPGNEPPLENIVDIAAGSDDFNILVKALAAAGLVETVRGLDDITVFAPTDAAFTGLATELGFDGDASDEEAVFGFIVDALSGLGGGDPKPLLTDILLYHVSPGAKSASEIDALDAVPTLLEGATFGSEGSELIDNEPDIANPNIAIPDIATENGTIQAIDLVLLPIDIPGNEPGLVIKGTNRRDDLSGGAGDDALVGFAGSDDLDGLAGNDKISGGRGRDSLDGGAGDDHLDGGRGADILDGGDGNDNLNGGWGRDLLIAGAGDDNLTGGRGADLFDFREIEGNNVVTDLSRADTIILSMSDFDNFEALVENASFEGGITVLEADRGTITLAGISEDNLDDNNFLFV